MPDRFGNIKIDTSAPVKPSTVTSEKKRPPRQDRKPKKKGSLFPSSKIMLFVGLPLTTLCTVLLFLYLYVPYYFTHSLPAKFQEHTGLELYIKQASFNPLTFDLGLSNLQLLDIEHFDIARINRLQARFSPLSLLRFDIVCPDFEMQGAHFEITRNRDLSYNISPLLKTSTTTNTPGGLMTFSDLPFFFSLNNIKVSDTQIVFKDNPAGKTHTVKNIEFDFPTLGNIPYKTEFTVVPKFSAVVNGSPIELTGSGSQDGKSTMSLDISSLLIPEYIGYLPFKLPTEFTKGTADGRVDISFPSESKKETGLLIRFTLILSDVIVNSDKSKLQISSPQTLISGGLNPGKRSLHVENLEIKTADFTTTEDTDLIEKLQTILTDHFDKEESGPSSVQPYSFTVENISVRDGSYLPGSSGQSDKKPKTWTNIEISIKNLAATPGQNSDGSFTFTGKKTKGEGTLQCSGNFNAAEVTGKTEFTNLAIKDPLSVIPGLNIIPASGNASGSFAFSYPLKDTDQNPFSIKEGSAQISNFEIADERDNQLKAQNLKLSGISYFNDTLQLGDASFEKGFIRINTSAPPKDFSVLSKNKVALSNFKFTGSGILQPGTKKKNGGALKTELTTLSINATDLNTAEPAKNNLQIEGKSNAGGLFSLNGILSLQPLSCRGDLGFDNFTPAEVFGTFGGSEFLSGLQGKVDGEGRFQFPQRKFLGQLHVREGGYKTDNASFSWQDLHVADVNYSAKPLHIGIGEMIFKTPQSNLSINKDSLPLALQIPAFFSENLPSLKYGEKSINNVSISPINIQRIIFDEGLQAIEDNRYSPSLKTTAAITKCIITDLNSSRKNAKTKISLNGTFANSPLFIEAELDLFHPGSVGSFELNLTSLPIPTFSEQLQGFPELSNESGTVDLVVQGNIAAEEYTQKASITLDGLQPTNLNSNIALAIALLSSQSNKLHVDVEEKVELDEPIPAIYDSVILNLQTLAIKASVSPLLLATGDFTDLIGNETVEFEPGEFMLTPEGRETLNRYAALLIEHPRIGLRLNGGLNLSIDQPALTGQLENAEQKRVDAENEKRFILWQQKKADYDQKTLQLQQQAAANNSFAESTIPRDVLEEFVPIKPVSISVDEEMLKELAMRRKEILKEHFTTQLTLYPERIIIEDSDKHFLDQSGDSEMAGVSVELRAIE